MIVGTTFALAVGLSSMSDVETGTLVLKNRPVRGVALLLGEAVKAHQTGVSTLASGNLTIQWDEATNRMHWSGPKARVSKFKALAALMDIRPVEVRVTVGVYSRFYDRVWTQTGTVENDGMIEISSREFGWTVRVSPRVTTEGEVMGVIKVVGAMTAVSDVQSVRTSATGMSPLGNLAFKQLLDHHEDAVTALRAYVAMGPQRTEAATTDELDVVIHAEPVPAKG